MVIYNDILFLICTIAIFFQGFSFSKRSTKIMLTSSIILILIPLVHIKLIGMEGYIDILSNEDTYDVITAVAYVLFWWILGYMIGLTRIIDKDKIIIEKMVQEIRKEER